MRELLAVDVGAGIRDGIDQPAALLGQLLGNRLAGDPRDLHQELVGCRDADRMIERGDLLALAGDVGQRLLGAELLHRDGRLGVHRVGRVLQRGAAVVHAEFAVGRRVPDVAVVAEDGVLDSHQAEDALDLADVADGVAVEAADEVDLFVGDALQPGTGAGFAVPEVLDDALHDVVVAGDVAADEGRCVGERHVEFRRNRTLLLGALDEGVQVVADHLRHACGGD